MIFNEQGNINISDDSLMNKTFIEDISDDSYLSENSHKRNFDLKDLEVSSYILNRHPSIKSSKIVQQKNIIEDESFNIDELSLSFENKNFNKIEEELEQNFNLSKELSKNKILRNEPELKEFEFNVLEDLDDCFNSFLESNRYQNKDSNSKIQTLLFENNTNINVPLISHKEVIIKLFT